MNKLAKFLTEREKKKVLVVSADVYRPAAIKQLETLANEINVGFFPSDIKQKPIFIASNGLIIYLFFLPSIIIEVLLDLNEPIPI